MLDALFQAKENQTETGIIEEDMLDGYYRVRLNGSSITARDQSGTALTVGSVASITRTTWGNFIVSAAGKSAHTIKKVIIRG